MKVIALDLETKRIGPGAVTPEIICATTATKRDGELVAMILGNDDKAKLEEYLKSALEACLIVGANIAYDMGCIWQHYPSLAPLVFKAYRESRVQDIQLNEKLHVLGTTGNLEFLELPDGSTTKVSYSLNELEKKYLAIDRRDSKTGGEDIWRTNYETLDGIPAEKYPDEAFDYALDDAANTLEIHILQQKSCTNQQTAAFRARVHFALFLMTMTGWAVDPEEVADLENWLEDELDDEKHSLLFESGILRPAEPPRPKLRGEGMTKEKPASKNLATLREEIEAVCGEHGIDIQLTDKGAVSTAKAMIDELVPHSPLFQQFSHRERLNKLKTTYLPQFRDDDGNIVPRIHASYDPLKRTGRSSSFKASLFPSTNIQQVDPRVRKCYVPDPGYILVSCDYSALELCSAAWRMKQLFGESKLYDLIASGKDAHCFTGSVVLADLLDDDFSKSCYGLTEDEKYDVFCRIQATDPEFYSHYRTFGKPTGLGYLGGLGAETFIKYAKTVYGIDVEAIARKKGIPAIDLAYQIREKWLDAFPDIRKYLREYIEAEWKYIDHYGEEKFRYDSPLGMQRAGASYTAAANGGAMQTPAAEGALEAVWRVQEACWDLPDSPLYGCVPLAFIHDEIIIEVPDDDTTTATTAELSKIMVESMESILTGVPIKAEPCMMRKWDKKAKPVFDDLGELVPYV